MKENNKMKLLHLLMIVALLAVVAMMGCVTVGQMQYQVYRAKIETIRWSRVIASDCQDDISRRFDEAERMTTDNYLQDESPIK